jgi:2-keto-3-deoxy-L-rhamnonate aldolase RhmA
MIIIRIYEYQNLLSLQLVSFLVGLRTYQHPFIKGEHVVAQLLQALRYRPEGRRFDSRCGHWDFSWT